MSVKYNIKMPDNHSRQFWRLLTENFNVLLLRKQHSPDGKTLFLEIEIVDLKTT